MPAKIVYDLPVDALVINGYLYFITFPHIIYAKVVFGVKLKSV